MQDRRIELAFLLYMSEEYLPLKTILATAVRSSESGCLLHIVFELLMYLSLYMCLPRVISHEANNPHACERFHSQASYSHMQGADIAFMWHASEMLAPLWGSNAFSPQYTVIQVWRIAVYDNL